MENKENNNLEMPIPAQQEQQADFSSIFNVASEETKEEKKEVPKPKAEEKETSTSPLPEDNKNPNREKNTFAFNSEERVLYEIKPEKESSPIVPLLFFVVLISLIIALPYISKKITFQFAQPTTTVNPNQTNERTEIFYFNKSSVRAKIGSLEFTNFLKSAINGEYRVTFNINNTAHKPYRFADKYFIIFYDKQERIVHRGLIHSYNAIGALAATSLTLNIPKAAYDLSDHFRIEKIDPATYPDVKLQRTEGEYEVMSCTYGYNTIEYYFKEGGLAKIKDVHKETSEAPNFEKNKTALRAKSSEYNQVENLTSIFVETKDDFTMINEFNLNEVNGVRLAQLKTYRFFQNKETKEVISFELEAQAYSCS